MKSIQHVLVALSIMLSTTTQAQMWTKPEADAFMKDCKEGMIEDLGEKVADEFCSCMLSKIMVEYKTQADAEKNFSDDAAMAMAMECMPAMSWNDETKNAYLEGCVGEAALDMGDEKSATFCNCMLNKTMTAYPNIMDLEKLTEEQVEAWKVQCTSGK